MSNIKFISYDGGYPCLCMGTLKLNIDGEDVIFSDSGEYSYVDKNNDLIFDKNCYPKFWTSGGKIETNGSWDMYSTQDDWQIFISEYNETFFPQKYLDIMNDLIKVFNENVPHGCCGGCI